MKSAFELALERSGGALSDVSDDKKKGIAAIDAKYKAKSAEAELAAVERLKKAAADPSKESEIKNDLARELDSIRFKCEKEKEAVRNSSKA
ncbi:MAG: hypothetical protein A2X49_17265 [Lentisphaerae bacterium GWF2_52_8]|nr:MAG: hypothetical protein A2X49_17265 [Lentisphaerae bacterium GWF2_52_8]